MFDHVDGTQLVKGAVRERVRETIEVADDVRRRGRIDINSNRSRIFVDAAADIQNLQILPRGSFPGCFRLVHGLAAFRLPVPAQTKERRDESADYVLFLLRSRLEVQHLDARQKFKVLLAK